jgi:hypothetical protein
MYGGKLTQLACRTPHSLLPFIRDGCIEDNGRLDEDVLVKLWLSSVLFPAVLFFVSTLADVFLPLLILQETHLTKPLSEPSPFFMTNPTPVRRLPNLQDKVTSLAMHSRRWPSLI